MNNAFSYIRDCFSFLMSDGATIAILVAVVTVSFFAFVLGADQELVYGLLAIGGLTAVVEARMHVKARDKTDASR
jgi:hypothetical protein